MFTFDLTPKIRTMMSADIVQPQPLTLPLTEQYYLFAESIRKMENEHRIRSLSVESVDNFIAPDDTLSTIYNYSYPLRGLMDTGDLTVPKSKSWFGFWEIYSETIVGRMIGKLNARREQVAEEAMQKLIQSLPRDQQGDPATIEKLQSMCKPIPTKITTFRSMHLDNDTASVTTLQRAITRIESESKSQINHKWLATLTDRPIDHHEIVQNQANWITGADNTYSLSPANLRTWKNKISVSLKAVDLVVSNEQHDTVSAIAFALSVLATDGSMIINVSSMSTAAVTMIYLISHYFERTMMIHTEAADKMYLYCEGFATMTTKLSKKLLEFAASNPVESGMSLLPPIVTNDDQFVTMLEQITAQMATIYQWRYDYYQKIILIYEELTKSHAVKTFSDYVDTLLSSNYKDQSEKWIKRTNFTFIAPTNGKKVF